MSLRIFRLQASRLEDKVRPLLSQVPPTLTDFPQRVRPHKKRRSSDNIDGKKCLKEFVATDRALLQGPISNQAFQAKRLSSKNERTHEKKFSRRLSVRQAACCIKSSFVEPASFASWSCAQFSPRLQPIRRIWRKHFEKKLHCCLAQHLPGA